MFELTLHRDQPLAGEAFAAKNCVILARIRWRETTHPSRKSTELDDAMTCCEAVMEVRIGRIRRSVSPPGLHNKRAEV
jgi:hypothetical protein